MFTNKYFLTAWHFAVIGAGIIMALHVGDIHTAIGILTGAAAVNAVSPSPVTTK